MLYSTTVRDGTDGAIGQLFAFRDVTRERQSERLKADFLSLVSHELRTPLTSIQGYVSLILDGDVGDIEDEQREFLGIVKENSNRLQALIDALLDISKIESGKIYLRRTQVNLTQVVTRVVVSLQPQFDNRHQSVTVDVPAQTPMMYADEERILQIVSNLVSNAYKYTPDGGSIDIAVRSDATHITMDVRDTGIGLSPGEQEQIFTKFYRANNRTTQEVGGTGLGLAITRSLVDLHGGTISVVSERNVGSTFSVTLPIGGIPAPSAV